MLERNTSRGQHVLWRSVPDDAVSYCFAANLIEDSEHYIALYQPHGAPIRRRTGRRGGPRGSILKDGWNGAHEERKWNGQPSVRVHPAGRPYAVIRAWDALAQRFDGWYVNLELPWLRSPLGYDSRDLVLDIVAENDLSVWHWKDDEHLSWSIDQGILTAGQATWIREAGWAAASDLESRRDVFDERLWKRWTPDDLWSTPTFGTNWSGGARVQTLPEPRR